MGRSKNRSSLTTAGFPRKTLTTLQTAKRKRKQKAAAKKGNNGTEPDPVADPPTMWVVDKILDYRLTEGAFDRSMGRRNVYLVVSWVGRGKDYWSIELLTNLFMPLPRTNIAPCKPKVMAFLEKKGFELKVDAEAGESWLDIRMNKLLRHQLKE